MLEGLFNENCLETMRRLPDTAIDLTVTSPPYDGLREYNGYSFDFEPIARELFRVTRDGGIVVWVVGDQSKDGSESGTSFRQALFFKSIGFRLHDTMIYRKKNFIPKNQNRCEQEFEYMFCFSKGRPSTFNPIRVPCATAGTTENFERKGWYGFKGGGFRRRAEEITVKDTKICGNIFEYTCGAERNGHPAVFPEALARDQIRMWSNNGDLIYDPFAGSGTTWKVAYEENRRWIGSEISAEYCDLIRNRMRPLLEQETIFNKFNIEK